MAENKPLHLSVESQGGSGATLGESTAPRAATGALLVDARKRKGLSVADVAGALRIRQVYLEAIEQGRLSDLPGAAYALGFVRTYAEYLGLDGNEIVRRFKDEANELGRKTELVFPLPLSEGRFPGRIVLLVSIALALFIYGVWHYTVSRDRSMVELVPPPPTASKGVTTPGDAKPAEPQTPAQPEAATAPAEPAKPAESTTPAPPASVSVPVPPPAAAPSPAPSASAPAQTQAQPTAQPPAGAPATSAPAAASQAPAATPSKPSPSSPSTTPAPAASAPLAPNPPPASAANPPPNASAPQANPPPPSVAAAGGSAQPAQTASADAPKVFGDDSASVRIQLKARAETWIQVSDENGKVIAMRTLKAGETYRVPNRSGLTLFTGNAGGLDVTVDGKKAPSLGASGTVRRNVALEPDGLLAGE